MLVILAEAATLSDAVRGYLMIARAQPFSIGLPRALWVAKAFPSNLAVFGCRVRWPAPAFFLRPSLIGLPLPWLGGLHLALMGGLGLGVLQVLSIAGLLHTGQPLRFSKTTRMAIQLLVLSVLSGSSRNSRRPSPCPSALTV